MKEEEIVEEFIKTPYCCGCKKPIFLVCGMPKVVLGGCCSKIIGKDTHYIRPMTYHINCYLRAVEEKTVKTVWKIDEIKKMLKENKKKIFD